MGWKLLKNRRWQGPYSSEELRQMLHNGHLNPSDFLLDEDNDEKFPTNYKTVGDILKISSPTYSSNPIAKDSKTETPSAKLSDFEREEITQLFQDQVEPTDLLKSNSSSAYDSLNAGVDITEQKIIPSFRERMRDVFAGRSYLWIFFILIIASTAIGIKHYGPQLSFFQSWKKSSIVDVQKGTRLPSATNAQETNARIIDRSDMASKNRIQSPRRPRNQSLVQKPSVHRAPSNYQEEEREEFRDEPEEPISRSRRSAGSSDSDNYNAREEDPSERSPYSEEDDEMIDDGREPDEEPQRGRRKRVNNEESVEEEYEEEVEGNDNEY